MICSLNILEIYRGLKSVIYLFHPFQMCITAPRMHTLAGPMEFVSCSSNLVALSSLRQRWRFVERFLRLALERERGNPAVERVTVSALHTEGPPGKGFIKCDPDNFFPGQS